MSAEAPGNRLFNDLTDESIEIAARGEAHVISGLAKGARRAFRTWRSAWRNAQHAANVQVSALFAEYEEA